MEALEPELFSSDYILYLGSDASNYDFIYLFSVSLSTQSHCKINLSMSGSKVSLNQQNQNLDKNCRIRESFKRIEEKYTKFITC